MGFSNKRGNCGVGEEGCPITAALEVDHTVLIARSWQNSLDQALSLPLLVVFKKIFKQEQNPLVFSLGSLLAFTSSRI